MNEKKRFYGWTYLGLMGVAYMFMMGFPQYGGPATAPFVLQAIPMERSVFGLGFTLFNLFVGVNSAFLAAPLIKRFGIRTTAIFGCLMLTVTAVLMQFVNHPILYILIFGVLTPITLACGTMVSYSTWVTRWFMKHRGRAMGILMTLASFGGFFAAPILVRVAISANGSFRASWLFMGAVGIVFAIVNFFLIKESPEAVGQIPDGTAIEATDEKVTSDKILSRHEWTAKEAYKTPSFWFLFVAGIAVFVPMFFFTAHFTLYAVSSGINPQLAAYALSAFAISGVAGRFVSGFFIERREARHVIAIGLLFSVVGAILALQIKGLETIILCGALFGAGFGWSYTSILTTVANFYGIKAYPEILGKWQLYTAILACPTSLIAGMVFDKTGSYRNMIIAVIVICFIGFATSLFAKMPEPMVRASAIINEE